MAEFRKDKPHSEIWGRVGVKYLQDGNYFTSSGEQVDEFGKPLKKASKSTNPPDGDGQGVAPPQEPHMKHKGGGRYIVYDENGSIVLEGVRKPEAEAKVEELKVNLEQINQALEDG